MRRAPPQPSCPSSLGPSTPSLQASQARPATTTSSSRWRRPELLLEEEESGAVAAAARLLLLLLVHLLFRLSLATAYQRVEKAERRLLRLTKCVEIVLTVGWTATYARPCVSVLDPRFASLNEAGRDLHTLAG